jgi:hypothetical protein
MRHHNTAFGAAVASLLALSGNALAAQSHSCSDVFDDAQRLACYDSAFGKPARPAGAALAVPAPATAPPVAPAVQRQAPAPVAKEAPVAGLIAAVGRLSNERFAITLDNGQVWMQLERDLSAEVRVGDTVQIKPAMLGSWMLETRGGVKTRVKLAR